MEELRPDPLDEVPDPSSTGLDPTLAALLAYLGLFVTGILFLLVERTSGYVRFHAMQSTITFIGLLVVMVVSRVLPLIGGLVYGLAWLLGLVLWLVLMWKAFQGERFQLPVVGDLAEERSQLPS